MRFGLSLPHYGFSLPGGEPITFDAMADWAVRAEGMGFDSIWISDHLFYSFERYGASPEPIAALEPMTSLAGLATVTDRIRLGTLVLCTPFRHPAILAKMAVTIDRLSNGRLDLGLGAGWLEQEFDAFGFPFASTGERFDALADTMRALDALFTADGPTDLSSRTVTLDGAMLVPGPVQRPRVPMWVGGKGGPRLLGLAARLADGWNAAWRWSPSTYAPRVKAAREACERVGRNPSTLKLSVGLYCLLGLDDAGYDAAFDRARTAMPGDAMHGETPDSWRTDTLSGTPEQVIERIREFEALGVEEIIIAPWVLPFAVPEPGHVDLFADRVLRPLQGAA